MIAQIASEATSLFNQVSVWSQKHGWKVSPQIDYLDLPNSQDYLEKPGIQIETGDGRIHLDAVGSKADGTAIVDMFAFPTLVRIRLLHAPGTDRWTPVTDIGMELKYDWNEDDFVRLAHDMLVV